MNYRLLFKQKEYMKFIIANAVSRLGDSIDAIAFTWLVYEKTGSASWSAIIFGLNKLPTIFLQPFLGVLGDLLDRKQMILLSHLARFLSVCLIIYWLYIDNISPVYLAIFTLLISTFEAINMPASSAFILEILDEDYYAYGNSFSSSLVTICCSTKLETILAPTGYPLISPIKNAKAPSPGTLNNGLIIGVNHLPEYFITLV